MYSLGVLDPQLDPRNHPEVKAGRLDPEEVDPVGEMMVTEFDLNPDEVSHEAFLKAYGLYLERQLPLDQVASRALEIEEQFQQRDRAIGILLSTS